MTKQVINVGTTANDKKGDSLRAAFQKVNTNFTELYTALGLATDVNLNLGNFVFTDNTISLTNSNNDDSTATQIEITQPVRIESDLTVGGDIVPSGNLQTNLGSPTHKFHSIYVGTGSVYIGDAKLSLEGGTLNSSVGFSTDSLTIGGNVLTVNQSGALESTGGIVGGGTSNRLVNGDAELVLYNTSVTGVLFPTTDGVNMIVQGAELGVVPESGTDNTAPLVLSSFNSHVNIKANAQGPRIDWYFNEDGRLLYPNNSVQQDTGTVQCSGNASTVVYTASSQLQHTVKLLIQVEGFEGEAEVFDTQSCEMIIAKSFRGDDIASTVYGIVHTSAEPLATFTAEWNATTSRVEVLCTTPSANGVNVRMFATEITTSD